MSLYNQIKKYTEEGKLVVTKAGDTYFVLNTTNYGFGDTLADAVNDLFYNPHLINGFYNCKNETILGFYNPDTGEVEAIEEKRCKPNPEIVDKSDEMSTKKGFDPENMTFDGVEIKAGDIVKVTNYDDSELLVDDDLEVDFAGYGCVKIAWLNITAHYPQKSELEKLEGELKEIQDAILHTVMGSQLDAIENGDLNAKYNGATVEELFDRYYQARKTLENLKDNQ
jgi:hypothetical protein